MSDFPNWSLIVAVNNESVLNGTLLASPAIDDQCQVILKRGYSCAGGAYNSGIADANHDLMVFAHQDIYLPRGWKADLGCALAQLEAQDPNWGAVGLVGMAVEPSHAIAGYCYSTGLQRIVGKPFDKPVEVISLDEIVLVIRRSSGLCFDDALPGFHLYGTDLCLEARKRDLRSYAVQAFCIHNTNGIKQFPMDFWRAYLYLRRKWWDYLPVQTCCIKIERGCGQAIHQVAGDLAHRVLQPRKVGSRWEDISRLCQHVDREQTELRQG